jgi:hypothetical protein
VFPPHKKKQGQPRKVQSQTLNSGLYNVSIPSAVLDLSVPIRAHYGDGDRRIVKERSGLLASSGRPGRAEKSVLAAPCILHCEKEGVYVLRTNECVVISFPSLL